MSFSQFRAALSFKKTDNQKPLVPVSSNPQHQPSTARTSAPRRSSITGRSAVQRIGSRRASIKPSMSIRRVNRPPRLGIESTHGTVSNESGEINAFYSGFFYDDDEVDGNGPNPFTPHSLQHTVPSRRTSNRQRASIFTRFASRVKSSENVTTRSQLPRPDNGHTLNSHPSFYSEESPSPNLTPTEAMASSEPSHLTSIIPDPARCSRFSLHGLGTLLLPQTPQPGFKHRNRNTALISPSMPTLEHHSLGIAESEWEDLGDTEEAPDEVKTKARPSDDGLHIAPGDVSPLSVLEPGTTRDKSQDLVAESAPLARCRTESISTASSGIDIDALPSVTSHFGTPFTPVADQFPTSVWDECQFSALRSSTDLIHGSNALADLIDVLGLDSKVAEGQRLSNKAPHESQGPTRKDALLGTQRPVTPPAEPLHAPSPTTPKYATTSASRRPTLDHPNSSTEPTPFSLDEEFNLSFHPILDIEVKKFSPPVTQAPKSSPHHPHRPRDRSTPEPHVPRSNRKSFLPDMSSWTIETEPRLRKAKRPSTEPQSSRRYMDQQPPSLDSLLPAKKGKGHTSNIFPRFLSRGAKPPPRHWPPVSPSQPVLLSQDPVARTPSTRPNSLKASRFERRASRADGSDSSWGSSTPPLPIMPHLNA